MIWDFFKKYWDLIGGFCGGIIIASISHFKLDSLQVAYSVIILILVCVGLFKIIKKEFEKRQHIKNERNKTIIDNLANSQKGARAIGFASHPTRDGERIGEMIIDLLKRSKRVMDKIKMFFDKFKGYILTAALGVLTIIEMCGGYINSAFGDKLMIGGVAIIPLVTLIATAVVGIVSNGFTKEQRAKIKVLLNSENKNEIVMAEIKKSVKDDKVKLKELTKTLTDEEKALDLLNKDLEKARRTYKAKLQMNTMQPQLATDEEVQKASIEVVNCEAKVVEKNSVIDSLNKEIEMVKTTINALKEQL